MELGFVSRGVARAQAACCDCGKGDQDGSRLSARPAATVAAPPGLTSSIWRSPQQDLAVPTIIGGHARLLCEQNDTPLRAGYPSVCCGKPSDRARTTAYLCASHSKNSAKRLRTSVTDARSPAPGSSWFARSGKTRYRGRELFTCPAQTRVGSEERNR